MSATEERLRHYFCSIIIRIKITSIIIIRITIIIKIIVIIIITTTTIIIIKTLFQEETIFDKTTSINHYTFYNMFLNIEPTTTN